MPFLNMDTVILNFQLLKPKYNILKEPGSPSKGKG